MITMEDWIDKNYTGSYKPPATTVRLWIKDGRISPRPTKHGKRWMFSPEAAYQDKINGKTTAKARTRR